MSKKITLSDENYIKCFEIKSTSIRLGEKPFTVGRTSIENVETGNEIDCIVTKVELMKVSDLDHRHALRDGFHSLGELAKELRKCYGKVSSNDVVTVVTFKSKYNTR